jgi:hypothetical protein
MLQLVKFYTTFWIAIIFDGDAGSDQNRTSDEKQYIILIVTKPFSYRKVLLQSLD